MGRNFWTIMGRFKKSKTQKEKTQTFIYQFLKVNNQRTPLPPTQTKHFEQLGTYLHFLLQEVLVTSPSHSTLWMIAIQIIFFKMWHAQEAQKILYFIIKNHLRFIRYCKVGCIILHSIVCWKYPALFDLWARNFKKASPFHIFWTNLSTSGIRHVSKSDHNLLWKHRVPSKV